MYCKACPALNNQDCVSSAFNQEMSEHKSPVYARNQGLEVSLSTIIFEHLYLSHSSFSEP